MITLDFESRGVADLKRVGQRRYAIDPATQVLCMCWQYSEQPIEDEVHVWHRAHPWIEQSPFPDELVERIRSGEIVEAHNAGMEYNIWNETLTREFPEFDVRLKPEQMRCSAAKASCLSLPRSLDEVTEFLQLKWRKLGDGKELIKRLSKPMPRRKDKTTGLYTSEAKFNESEELHRRNWIYCQGDVRAERGLSEFLPEMSERELQYWLMDFRMNCRGVTLDLPSVQRAMQMAVSETKRLNTELAQLTGGKVLAGSQRASFLKWMNARLEEAGEKPLPDTQANTLSFLLDGVPTKAGEEAFEAARERMQAKWDGLGSQGAQIHRAARICMEVNRSSVAKFRTMEQAFCADTGRVHDIMLYNGAGRTGRWSGKGIQPHNFVRGWAQEMVRVWGDINSLDPSLIEMVWGDPLVVLAKACRGALMASPGKVLYAADFNAIEARKLAWLANCAPMLKCFTTKGMDIYCDMASGIYKRPITKNDKSERQLGKKAILGLGYGMSWEKFQATVYADEGIWLDDEFCKLVVNIYRKEKYPEVPALWNAAQKAAIAAVRDGGTHYAGGDEFGCGAVAYFMSDDRNFLMCRLPSGRLLAYFQPRVSQRVTYRYPALNERGTACHVTFTAKKTTSQFLVRRHVEQLAPRQRKVLLPNAQPDSYVGYHLSYMGQNNVTKKWERIGSHGGLLVENFDQASSRDLLAEAMDRIDQMDEFDLLLSIHDEVIAEGAEGVCSLKQFEDIMAVVPAWAPGMPITAEGWIGSRLRK